MRFGRPRYKRWAAGCGLAALLLNALVPVHIAFDLAQAFAAASPGHHSHGPARTATWRLLSLFTGHHEADGPRDRHGHHGQGSDGQTSCAVCLTLAALGGFALPVVIAMPLPPPATTPVTLAGIAGEPATAPLAYRSRAPPLA